MTEPNSPVLLAPEGRLDASNATAFEAEMLAVLPQSSIGLVMDFGGLSYVSSAGLRVVLLAAKKVKAGGGRFVLCGLSPQIAEVFKVSGFLAILNVAPNRAAAFAQFA